jgi:tetratricopeptide repeat protein
LATMCADALMRLGDVDEARRWYRTAIHAADDSGQAWLRVLVRAQAAMLPYYFREIRVRPSLSLRRHWR